ncbi:bifunctional tetrahydrofolate synthase/dihydrofolate synthase [Morganella psychrotolerans]|uniref:Dihydrofolate synthase/folylpolyglutamate synthase n=1 Tax=Morganella psychrotolerans TaxID=368603 RepID=A0A5M9RBH2_9GAMM|nr:bifunctional tetrahydrofolate synthase/dihydrofolate synthase [Morganella psychrotolerans]KAA8716795.1 bifunctional tetrahydrofolate synthase/dihydrofolate synthase [Morganella psychrotolerans]OBU08851.1 bifunctional tetrahydrofolate synthase/dihydrofolate synthase [Morganella psychrotolerans]
MSDKQEKLTAASSLMAWLSYLGDLHSQVIDMGLERVGAVADIMNLRYPAPKVITVSGTNGKGTTCHTLESVFLAAGLRVGVYSSPHLINYTERVRIQGENPSEADFCRVFADIDAQRGDITLTYFEAGTLAALQLFREANLDVVILEVGLGGRLDATNIVDSHITAITSIALDHTDWLGADREHIAREKAGIFRPHCVAVIGEPDAPYTIADVANKLETSLFCRVDDWSYKEQGDHWTWQCEDETLTNLPLPNVPLANAATALAVIHNLRLVKDKTGRAINREAIDAGLRQAQLPGRFQIVSQHPLTVLDVAHNPHAAGYLVSKLAQLPRTADSRVRAVVGMLGDKDIKGTLAVLSEQVTDWYFAPLTELRGAPAEQLAEHIPGAQLFADVESAWAQACLDADAGDIIVVCGSFHTVAHVMDVLSSEEGAGGQ